MLKKKSQKEIGFDYAFYRKEWMNLIIFFVYLNSFHAYIARTPNRKVLLILENFSGHGSQHYMPSLSAVDILFFPANKTSCLPPMEMESFTV